MSGDLSELVSDLRRIRPARVNPAPDDAEFWDRRRELEDELRRTGVDPFARLVHEEWAECDEC